MLHITNLINNDMISHARAIGAFVIWVAKGCKTNFEDELWGEDGTYMGSNDFRNIVVGYIVVCAFLGLLYLFLSHKYSGE